MYNYTYFIILKPIIYDVFIKSEKMIFKLLLDYTPYKLSYLILFSFVENIQYTYIFHCVTHILCDKNSLSKDYNSIIYKKYISVCREMELTLQIIV